MSGQQPPSSAGPAGHRPSVNGNINGVQPSAQHRSNDGQLGGNSAQNGNMSAQNLNQIVIDYLAKKGYTRTEATLRIESSYQDAQGRPVQSLIEDTAGVKYHKAFHLLKNWIEQSLDVYKADLRRLLWPIFVYSVLKLVSDFLPIDSRDYFNEFREQFQNEHSNELRALAPISLPEHANDNEIARIYRSQKYRVTLSTLAWTNLLIFLESKSKEGGAVIVTILQTHLQVVTVDRAFNDSNSLARLIGRARGVEDFPAEDEGIPGHNPGSANTDPNAAGSNVLAKVWLGPMPMEDGITDEIRRELEAEDLRHPPVNGQGSLSQHFEQHIKREESEDAPNRSNIPLPAATARDVAMEVQKVKENRDRFKIEGRTGGVAPGVSVIMFTFHNTNDSINCVDFSDDYLLVAAGMAEHYIRIWSMDGKALPTLIAGAQASASRRLFGHAGPVYAVSFSPSTPPPAGSAPESTAPKYLLSCSADKDIRLWSLETWTCLVVYKGHTVPVWDVKWGPFGHYFLTGSADNVARLWATPQITDLRMFVGHDQDVDTVCFHPNGAYVFTGSCDQNVRMWAVSNGFPVRMFTGHTGNITSMACSNNGKCLASADDAGSILLWDLASGRLQKRMRGHGKGGIWSMDWNVESTILVSGGADGTVRVWDVVGPSDASGQGRVVGEGSTGQKSDAGMQAGTGLAGTVGKKKAKEVVVTPDQISAFPTKKSPVYKVKFTRQNLIMAGGAYLP